MNYSVTVKEKLFDLIDEMDGERWLYTKNPKTDFSRVKKWTFGDTVKFILSMEGKSLKDEILSFFDYSIDTPSNSSFNQRRAQIRPEAFEVLFNKFTRYFDENDSSSDYRFIACDGSDLCITRNTHDLSTYFPKSYTNKGFNLLHMNTLYDLDSRTYVDALIQPGRENHENKALWEMIDRYSGPKNTVIIADRGYEHYNTLAHIEQNGLFYLIRAKDIFSTGIMSGFKSKYGATDVFDDWVTLGLTRKQTNDVRSKPDKYRHIKYRVTFDYLEHKSSQIYNLNMRIIRFPIADDSYECIITNLPTDVFPTYRIKEDQVILP